MKSTFDFRHPAPQLLLLCRDQRLCEPVERVELVIRQLGERYLLVKNLKGVLRVASSVAA